MESVLCGSHRGLSEISNQIACVENRTFPIIKKKEMMSPRGSAFPEDEDVSKMLEERLNDTIVTLAGKRLRPDPIPELEIDPS